MELNYEKASKRLQRSKVPDLETRNDIEGDAGCQSESYFIDCDRHGVHSRGKMKRDGSIICLECSIV